MDTRIFIIIFLEKNCILREKKKSSEKRCLNKQMDL